jgi:hypothetical protein
MANYLDSLLEKIESRWSLATLVWQTVGAVMSFGIPAWAAHATAWLNRFGPIAWVTCGFAGLLLFAAFLVLIAVFRERFIVASIRRRFYEKADGINPLEPTFRNQRIYLSDLISPIEPAVKNKTCTRGKSTGRLFQFSRRCVLDAKENGRFPPLSSVPLRHAAPACQYFCPSY